MADLVYIVRPGNDNPELRYSLRSVEANLPHERVWIFGHRPRWCVNVEHVFMAQRDPALYKRENALSLLGLITAQAIDRFVLMNDDFFVVDMAPAEPAPVHRGRLASLADDRELARPKSKYARLLRLTDQLLREAGIGEPLAYETHTPMTMTRQQLSSTLGYIDLHSAGEQLAPRSILGNLYQLGGAQIGNVKVYGSESAPPSAGPFLSTTDMSFRYHDIGDRLRRAFPRPSRYEQA